MFEAQRGVCDRCRKPIGTDKLLENGKLEHRFRIIGDRIVCDVCVEGRPDHTWYVSLKQAFEDGREDVTIMTVMTCGYDCYEAMDIAKVQRPEWWETLYSATFEGQYYIFTRRID